MMCLQLRLKMSYSLCFIFHVSCCFISVGKTPASIKRRINQYPARLSGGLQSPTEINAQLHNAPQEHCYACIGTRGCAGIRFGRSQLTLTRIPRQFSRARIESGSLKVKDAGSFSKEDLWNESSLQWWYNESCRKLRRNHSGGRKPALL